MQVAVDAVTSFDCRLMIDDAQVARDQLVFQARPIWNHDPVALVGNDDTCPRQTDTLAEPHVTGDGEMIQLGDVGYGLESFLEICDLLELITELDDGSTAKFSRLVHGQNAVLKVVQFGLDQEQVRARFDGQET